jgi:hypothetical protein
MSLFLFNQINHFLESKISEIKSRINEISDLISVFRLVQTHEA